MVSTFVEDGSREGIEGLREAADTEGDRFIKHIASEAGKTVGLSNSKDLISRTKRLKSHKQRFKSGVGGKRRQKVSYDIQNLIDSA